MTSGPSKYITVVGAGYVGLVNAVCLAGVGHRVRCLDRDGLKIVRLRTGDTGVREPGLDELMKKNIDAGRLEFFDDYDAAMHGAEVVFICVDTPVDPVTGPDLRSLTEAVDHAASRVGDATVLVLRSTVPPGTSAAIERRLAESDGTRALPVVSHPEFFQEGRAVEDCQKPLRIVVGSRDRSAAEMVAGLWGESVAPVVTTNPATAEMIKQASNAFLAAKVSFINDVAGICSLVGADIDTVAKAMGMDPRIGSSYLKAGIGFGGSCLPKDLRALIATASSLGWNPRMLIAALEVNERQRRVVVDALKERLGSLETRTIALLGLTFKPDTSDLRDSPAIAIAEMLLSEGATVRATDPTTGGQAGARLPGGLIMARDAYEAAEGADALLLATEWREFQSLDWRRIASAMKGSLVVDGRNALDRDAVIAVGLIYSGIGPAFTRAPGPSVLATEPPR